MKTYYNLIDILALILIPIFGIAGIINSFSGDTIIALIYGILAAIFAILEGISMLIDKIEIYHGETKLLRSDLAKLNLEISNAFNKVDTNFRALVGAIDDFAAELEAEEKE